MSNMLTKENPSFSSFFFPNVLIPSFFSFFLRKFLSPLGLELGTSHKPSPTLYHFSQASRAISLYQIAIHDVLLSIFYEFEIQNKNYTAFDYILNNINAIDKFVRSSRDPFGKIYHMICVCHMVNSIVLDGLKIIAPSLNSM